MGKFCDANGLAPKDLLTLEDKEIRNILLDYITSLEESDYSSSYLRSIVNAVKSWLKFNNRNLALNIKIRSSQPKIAQTERVPTKDELRKIISIADMRAKAAIGLIAFSGLRPEVLGNYRGRLKF